MSGRALFKALEERVPSSIRKDWDDQHHKRQEAWDWLAEQLDEHDVILTDDDGQPLSAEDDDLGFDDGPADADDGEGGEDGLRDDESIAGHLARRVGGR